MNIPIRRLPHPDLEAEETVTAEWLVTNGLGGYASGPIGGRVTRRYHGVLVAALPAPMGRMVMVSHVDTRVRLPTGQLVALEPVISDSDERSSVQPLIASLVEFRLESGLPVWQYAADGVTLEKRVV